MARKFWNAFMGLVMMVFITLLFIENGYIVPHTPREKAKLKASKDTSSHILIVSSLGRSGTSFLGEIITNFFKEDYFYIYEPFYPISDLFKSMNLTKSENKLRKIGKHGILKCLFLCNIIPEVVKLTEKVLKNTFIVFRHPDLYNNKNRLTNPRRDDRVEYFSSLCSGERVKIVKSIRIDMNSIGNLLNDSDLDLKVVYLTRDPRASLQSSVKVKWNLDPQIICTDYFNDLGLSDELLQRYPDKFVRVMYEDLCTDVWSTTANLYKFLLSKQGSLDKQTHHQRFQFANYTKSDALNILPKTSSDYLKLHSIINDKTNDYSTFRDTKNIIQDWRLEIEDRHLQIFEEKCKNPLQKLGLNIFGSLENVRNMSIPIFDRDK